jgi:hypothetical protein
MYPQAVTLYLELSVKQEKRKRKNLPVIVHVVEVVVEHQEVSARVEEGGHDLIGIAEQLITSSKAKITRTIGSPFHSPINTEREMFSDNLVCNELISTDPILVQSPVC